MWFEDRALSWSSGLEDTPFCLNSGQRIQIIELVKDTYPPGIVQLKSRRSLYFICLPSQISCQSPVSVHHCESVSQREGR